MTTFLRGKDLIGLPVVDVRTGTDVGQVRDVVFDPADGRLSGFTVIGRGLFDATTSSVGIDDVVGVGDGAVMVADVLAAAPSDEVEVASDIGKEVTDDLVVTESGTTIGRVRDVVVAAGRMPRVVGFEVERDDAPNAFIPRSTRADTSGTAMVVPDSFTELVRDDFSALAEQLRTLEAGDAGGVGQ